MPYKKIGQFGLMVPADFPIQPFLSAHNNFVALNKRITFSDVTFMEYSFAWNALAYRFRSCAEHDDKFTKSVVRFGIAPRIAERYHQEREFHAFFTCGLSTLESLSYGIFAVCSALDHLTFPFASEKDFKQINIKRTATAFLKKYPSHHFGISLENLVNSNEFQEWQRFRNMLTHRTSPGRSLVMGKSGALLRGQTLMIDEQTTRKRRLWLADALTTLLTAAEDFSVTHC